MSNEVRQCPKCGRKMSQHREQCFRCDNIEVRDAQEFVDEALAVAPAKRERVTPERVKEIAASLEHLRDVLPGDSWHLGASLKHHDTRYRDKDPFAYKSCGALTAMMEGLSPEDVLRWDSAPNTGKFDSLNHDSIVRSECNGINRAFSQSLEGEDTWFRLQRLIEEDKLSIQDEYSLKLALKKSKALVPHIVDDEGNVSLDINGLAMSADEASGRSGTKNHAKRIRVSAGFVELKQVKVSKNDELIDIIRKLEKEQFAEIEECYVKVTNIGTNPYTHEQVRVPSRPINYDVIRVDGQVYEDALAPLREFYGQFDMHKHNYVGTVNKKSDGRCPRTGSYPNPKSPDMMQLYRHQPSIIITPNVNIQETTHTVKFKHEGSLQEEKEISKVTRGEDCECGCNVKVKDMRRGEVICPKCGLVFHRDTIVG